jgi:hypothetical protein
MTLTKNHWQSVEHLMPTVGRWDVARTQFLGPDAPDSRHPLGLCLSDVTLNEGEVSVVVRLSADSAGRILLGYRSQDEPYYSIGLGGYTGAFVVSEYLPIEGWHGRAVAGSAQNLSTERDYEVRVQLVGQRATLIVDGVRVIEYTLRRPIGSEQIGLFAWGPGPVSFSRLQYFRRLGKAFVVMQFSDAYQQLYKQVIQPVARQFGLEAYHAGEVYSQGLILKDIIDGIVSSQVIIAEVTPANQNVFYELGYAHAIGKPTILLAERGKQLPFDITGHRCVFYDNTIAGKAEVEETLGKHLASLFGSDSIPPPPP